MTHQQRHESQALAAAGRRIILLGKTGNGKSSTGNSLIQTNEVFKTYDRLSSGTQVCQQEHGYYGTNKLNLTVVDTPGLMDTDVKLADRLLEIQRSIDICPEPHAFLLVFNAYNKFTKDEKFTIDLLRVAFGERVFQHCIVVFTHGRKFKTDQAFENFWKGSDIMAKLVEKCGNRILRIENESSVNSGCTESMKNIIEMMESMSQNGKIVYQYNFTETHKTVLLNHLKKFEREGNLHEELSLIATNLGKHLQKSVWAVMLFGGEILTPVVVRLGAAYFGEVVAPTVVQKLASVGSAALSGAMSFTGKLKFW